MSQRLLLCLSTQERSQSPSWRPGRLGQQLLHTLLEQALVWRLRVGRVGWPGAVHGPSLPGLPIVPFDQQSHRGILGKEVMFLLGLAAWSRAGD